MLGLLSRRRVTSGFLPWLSTVVVCPGPGVDAEAYDVLVVRNDSSLKTKLQKLLSCVPETAFRSRLQYYVTMYLDKRLSKAQFQACCRAYSGLVTSVLGRTEAAARGWLLSAERGLAKIKTTHGEPYELALAELEASKQDLQRASYAITSVRIVVGLMLQAVAGHDFSPVSSHLIADPSNQSTTDLPFTCLTDDDPLGSGVVLYRARKYRMDGKDYGLEFAEPQLPCHEDALLRATFVKNWWLERVQEALYTAARGLDSPSLGLSPELDEPARYWYQQEVAGEFEKRAAMEIRRLEQEREHAGFFRRLFDKLFRKTSKSTEEGGALTGCGSSFGPPVIDVFRPPADVFRNTASMGRGPREVCESACALAAIERTHLTRMREWHAHTALLRAIAPQTAFHGRRGERVPRQLAGREVVGGDSVLDGTTLFNPRFLTYTPGLAGPARLAHVDERTLLALAAQCATNPHTAALLLTLHNFHRYYLCDDVDGRDSRAWTEFGTETDTPAGTPDGATHDHDGATHDHDGATYEHDGATDGHDGAMHDHDGATHDQDGAAHGYDGATYGQARLDMAYLDPEGCTDHSDCSSVRAPGFSDPGLSDPGFPGPVLRSPGLPGVDMSESGLGVCAGADFLLTALEGCVSEVAECVSAASASLRALPSAQEAFYLTERQLRRRLRVVGAAGVKAKGSKAASGSLKCEMLAWLRCREGLSGSAAAAKLAARFWTSPSAARELCDARSDWCALRRAVRVLHAQARRMDAAQDRDAHTTPAELFLWQKADTCGRWAATGARSRFALCYNSLVQQYFLALNTRLDLLHAIAAHLARTLTRPHRDPRQHRPHVAQHKAIQLSKRGECEEAR